MAKKKTSRKVEVAKQKTAKLKKQHGKDLYIRARKKIGMSDAQIETYGTPELLKRACDGISPQTNPDIRPQKGTVRPPLNKPPVPDKIEFDSKFVASGFASRRQFDEAALQAKLRELNRRHGSPKPVKIVQTTYFKPVQGKDEVGRIAAVLITHFEIVMKEQG